MTEQQNNLMTERYAKKFQAREARRAARQQQREARHAARLQRPRRDWSFEVKAGDKTYTFHWRWHKDVEATEQAQTAEMDDSQSEPSAGSAPADSDQ